MTLASELVERIPGAATHSMTELEALLEGGVARAREAWPEVDLADADFLAYLASRLSPELALDEAVRPLCITDLWLACAMLRAEPAALAAFETEQLSHVAAAISHLDGGSALVLDTMHAVRERVLGGAASTGKLADYRGRGDLRGWLRVIAVREALQILRARRRETALPDDLASQLQDPAVTPALTPNEQVVYRQAFEAALATLTPRERNLMRQQHIYGATIDELGALYGVHRATAARWLTQIRETVLRRTRRHIGEALRLTHDDLDSAMGKLAEHLDYSLRHTLSQEP